ncbi:hypothetical protein [Maribellus maritimus]|uniref:hypothetical protein n=1 Tax=Maribellus maritimus TaxID=2870838 RepID=UPI001EEB0A72|nr:hypothetical protein [Maribellus maritimus]MCG6187107.1 hypothetical protein [Maribellus maritimus]
MNGLFLGIIYLVSISFFITLFFIMLLKRRGPWGSFWTFFAIILLSVFVADTWVGPVGPIFFNHIYWVPPLTVGLLIALLLAATTPSPKTKSELELQKKEITENKKATITLGTFFWFLFAVMLMLIIAGSVFK